MKHDAERPTSYDAAGIAEWMRGLLSACPGGFSAQMRVAPRSTTYIDVRTLPSGAGAVQLATTADRWRNFPTVEQAADVAAKICAEAQFVAAVEARTLRARNALAAREELLYDLLDAARAQIDDRQRGDGRTMCDAFDEALTRLDARYPHLARRKDPGRKPAEIRVAEFRRRMDEVNL